MTVDIIEQHRQKCHPDVWDASAAELDAAGWGEAKDRTKIPANWRELDTPEKRRAETNRIYRQQHDIMRTSQKSRVCCGCSRATKRVTCPHCHHTIGEHCQPFQRAPKLKSDIMTRIRGRMTR